MTAILCFWLLCLGGEPTPPGTVELPRRMEAGPGRLLRIEAKTSGKQIRWHLEGADPQPPLNPPESPADLVVMESGRMAIFCAPKPGIFRVLAWTATGDTPGAPALCIIEIRDPKDNPDNPDKKPTDPKPQTDLAPLIQAIGEIPPSGRREPLLLLAKIYRKGEKLSRAESVASLGELHETLAKEAMETIDPEALLPVRRAVAELTQRELGNRSGAALDGFTRIKAARWFGALASTLETFAALEKAEKSSEKAQKRTANE